MSSTVAQVSLQQQQTSAVETTEKKHVSKKSDTGLSPKTTPTKYNAEEIPQRISTKHLDYDIYQFKVALPGPLGAEQQTQHGNEKRRYKTYKFPYEEVNRLAIAIGFDLENDIEEHLWFLKRILIQELPLGWVKEQMATGETFFHNSQLNITTMRHPYTNNFRKIFNTIVTSQSEKASQVKSDVTQLALDLVLAENAAKAKKMKLINRVQFKKSTTVILTGTVNNTDDVNDDIQSGINQIHDIKDTLYGMERQATQVYEDVAKQNALLKALTFYEKLIGLNIRKTPYFLKNNRQYLQIKPEVLIKLAMRFKLDFHSEVDLIWVPRMLFCLPLPPLWQKSVSNRVENGHHQGDIIYKDIESECMFSFHPAELFLIKLLNKLRMDRKKVTQQEQQQQHQQQQQKQQRPTSPSNSNMQRRRKQSGQTQQVDADVLVKRVKFLDELNRVYTCTQKDIMEIALEEVKAEKNVEDLFQNETQAESFNPFEVLKLLFKKQVTQTYHEKWLSDSEIRILAKQCKLTEQRDLYLYKTIYEFLLKKYKQQEEELFVVQGTDLQKPKVWLFRITSEEEGSQFYWIEQYSKEIAKLYPYLKELRNYIDEIKVTNNAIEQYVVSEMPASKSLKDVDTYFKIKSYSNSYLQQQLMMSPGEQKKRTSELEDGNRENKNYLGQVIEDLALEEGVDISREQLLEWMFAWPYHLSAAYFDKYEEVQSKIKEDLDLIRQKDTNRQEIMGRIFKKINMVNKLGKGLGSSNKLKNLGAAGKNTNKNNDDNAQAKAQEELQQKIKEKKLVIGVSDIKIKKKLIDLLEQAIIDEQNNNNQEERSAQHDMDKSSNNSRTFESNQRQRGQLAQRLKEQLGLNESDLRIQEEDDESPAHQANRLPRPKSKGDDSGDSKSEIDFGELQLNDDDEPADDSFTYLKQKQVEFEYENSIGDDGEEEMEEFVDNVLDLDDHEYQQQQQQQNQQLQITSPPSSIHQGPHSNLMSPVEAGLLTQEIIYQRIAKEILALMKNHETVEDYRQRVQNEYIQNKLKQLVESNLFLKRVRKKLNQMSIVKTTNGLKKKILQLKTLQLKVQNDGDSPKQLGERDADEERPFDFLAEMQKMQSEQNESSSDDGFSEDEDDDLKDKNFKKIFEVNAEEEESQIIERQKEEESEPLDTSSFDKDNNFYNEFDELDKIKKAVQESKRSIPSTFLQRKSMIRNFSQVRNQDSSPERESVLKREGKGGLARMVSTEFDSNHRTPKRNKTGSMRELISVHSTDEVATSSNLSTSQRKSQMRSIDQRKQQIDSEVSNDAKISKQYTANRRETDNSNNNNVSDGLIKIRQMQTGSDEEAEGSQNEGSEEQDQMAANGGATTAKNDGKGKNQMLLSHQSMKVVVQQSGEYKDIKAASEVKIKLHSMKNVNPDGNNQLEFQKQFDKDQKQREDGRGFDNEINSLLDVSVNQQRKKQHLSNSISDSGRSDDNDVDALEGFPNATAANTFQAKQNNSKNLSKIQQNKIRGGNARSRPQSIDMASSVDTQFERQMKLTTKLFEESVELDENLFTEQEIAIYDYYVREIGSPDEPKWKLNLCTKLTMALNMDSILFTAQRLRIKVLAQRETNLLWIAVEYLLHLSPQLKGVENCETMIDKVKNHYFKKMVKSQRKQKLTLFNDSKKAGYTADHEQYMVDESWVQLWDQGAYIRHNFYTQEKQRIQVQRHMTQLSNVVANSSLSKKSRYCQQSLDAKMQTMRARSKSILNQVAQFPFSGSNIQRRSRMTFMKHQSQQITDESQQLTQSAKSSHNKRSPVRQIDLGRANKMSLRDSGGGNDLIEILDDDEAYPEEMREYFERTSTRQQHQLQQRAASTLTPRHSQMRAPPLTGIGFRQQLPKIPSIKCRPILTERARQYGQIYVDGAAQSTSNSCTATPAQFAQGDKRRNIKRIIMNNHKESYLRLQIGDQKDRLKTQRGSNGYFSQQQKVCEKHQEQHHIVSPGQDLDEMMLNSANFSQKIFHNMQNKIQLKAVSYLSQQQYQADCNKERVKIQAQKAALSQKLEKAQLLATMMPFHYYRLILDGNQEKRLLLLDSEKQGIKLDEIDSESIGFSQPQSSRGHLGRRDFRYMSPKSIARWAHHSDLNYALAQQVNIINKNVGLKSYNKLKRTQDNKMTFPTYLMHQIIDEQNVLLQRNDIK